MPDHDGDASHVRQQRIFELYFNRTYPCEDHTDMCKTWANNQPESCNPGNEHYDFMKLACMDSCKICQDHVSNMKNTSNHIFLNKNFKRI